MTGFEAYCKTIALKAHFTGDYDFFRYRGKVKRSLIDYESRPDWGNYETAARRRDAEDFLLSCVLESERAFIGSALHLDRIADYHRERMKRVEGLTYHVGNEILQHGGVTELMSVRVGHPRALREYMAGRLSLEALTVLLRITKMAERWDKRLGADPIWRRTKTKTEKYWPFLAQKVSEREMKLGLARRLLGSTESRP